MKKTLTILGFLAVFPAGAALADDDCFVPMANWQPRDAVALLAEENGWTVRRIKIDDGCYEIDGRDAEGRRIEVTVHPATLEVIGDAAQITMVRLNMGGTINKGTLRFVLGISGVSQVRSLGWMNLGAAKLEVDGSAYQGGPATMVLVDSTNMVGEVPTNNITLSGFDPSLSVSVVQDLTLDQVRLVIE